MSKLSTELARVQPATGRSFCGHRVMAYVLCTDRSVVCNSSIRNRRIERQVPPRSQSRRFRRLPHRFRPRNSTASGPALISQPGLKRPHGGRPGAAPHREKAAWATCDGRAKQRRGGRLQHAVCPRACDHPTGTGQTGQGDGPPTRHARLLAGNFMPSCAPRFFAVRIERARSAPRGREGLIQIGTKIVKRLQPDR